ncbi:unnamed protein product [Eruca vesicaria subsp. sativa]|uniref:Uncharacterized protein n=1 Tax=Eruca vesicaria subsp. sativa TaxID=29727 RepID=A0ABC8K7N1_ERUVS|nr:unnamed protein product [Eruca vesicaria subsp. sativa]
MKMKPFLCMMLVLEEGYLEIVELLFSRASGPEYVKRMIETIDVEGASPTIKNSYGKTPSELADVNTDAKRILEAATGDSLSS